METLRLLSTTAAVLPLGAAAVSAQSVKNDENPARAPAAQQNAPAEKMAPEMKPGEQKATTKKAPETVGQASDSEQSPTRDKKAQRGAADLKANKSDATGGRVGANKETGRSSAKSLGEQSQGTTGQGAAAGSAKLTAEQRSRITTIIKQKQHKVEPAHLKVRTATSGDRYRHRARYRECRIERRDFENRYDRIHIRRVRVCD